MLKEKMAIMVKFTNLGLELDPKLIESLKKWQAFLFIAEQGETGGEASMSTQMIKKYDKQLPFHEIFVTLHPLSATSGRAGPIAQLVRAPDS